VGVKNQAKDKATLIAISKFLDLPFMSFAPPSGSNIAYIPLGSVVKPIDIYEKIKPLTEEEGKAEEALTPDKANPAPPVAGKLPKFQPSKSVREVKPASKPKPRPQPKPAPKPAAKPAPPKKKKHK
jgi:hypothetical protein